MRVGGANSASFVPIRRSGDYLMSQQERVSDKGGLCAGQYPANMPKTLAHTTYGDRLLISERHRHRYEFNNRYREELVAKGFVISDCPGRRTGGDFDCQSPLVPGLPISP